MTVGLTPSRADNRNSSSAEHLVDYYTEAGADYEAWSRGFNMHFGLYRRFMNPFDLEGMLECMNVEALDRLRIGADAGVQLLDMGCGLGATARSAARRYPSATVTGVTLVPWQIEQARRMAADAALERNLAFRQCDYTATPFADATFDGAWAIESACHGEGYDKAPFVREAFRLLRPGARLVVVDGFLKKTTPMNPLFRACVDRVSSNWAVETFAAIDPFTERLRAAGFVDVTATEESWSIAPSVMFIPWVTLKFLLLPRYRRGTGLRGRRREHLIACMLAPFVGMARRRFGYYIVTAVKPTAALDRSSGSGAGGFDP